MDIDFSYFNEVTFGDKMLMLEFIDIFEKQIPEIVNDLKNALNEKNYKKIASIAHKAKSSVAVFGMKKWEKALKDLQISIEKGEIPENLDTFILEFQKEAYETIKIYKEYVDKQN
jgi:HPt (histidine-containing phosphotransfer) domain-containing protein